MTHLSDKSDKACPPLPLSFWPVHLLLTVRTDPEGSPNALEGTTARPKHSAPLGRAPPYPLLLWFAFAFPLRCFPRAALCPLIKRAPVQRTAAVEGALIPRRRRQKQNEGEGRREVLPRARRWLAPQGHASGSQRRIAGLRLAFFSPPSCRGTWWNGRGVGQAMDRVWTAARRGTGTQAWRNCATAYSTAPASSACCIFLAAAPRSLLSFSHV
jgi:hypothetical protein